MRTSLLSRLSRLFVGLAVLLVVLPETPSHAQTEEDAFYFSQRSPLTGARLSGMGGAGIAGIGDYSALFVNPAGLGWLDASQAAGTFRTLSASNEATYATIFEDTNGDGGVGPTDNPTARLVDRTTTDYAIGNAALAYKFPTERGSFVLGLAINETRTFDRPTDFQNRNQLSSVTDFFLPIGSEVNVERYPIGGAPDDLFVGQRLFEGPDADYLLDFDPDGDGIVNRPLSLAAFDAFGIDFLPDLYENGATDAGSFITGMGPGTNFLQVGDVSEEGTLRDFNMGVAWEASPGVMVGLSTNVSFGRYEFDSLFEEIDDRDQNNGSTFVPVNDTLEVSTLPVDRFQYTQSITSDLVGIGFRFGVSADLVPERLRGGVTIETPTWYSISETSNLGVTGILDDGSQFASAPSIGRTEFDYELRTPWRLGLGLSGTVLPSLTLSGDLQFVDWKTMRLSEDGNTGVFDAANRVIEDAYDPVVHARVGAEYTVEGLTLRAGFAYQPDPTEVTVNGDSRDRTYLTAGLGYKLSEELSLNASFAQERFQDQYLPYGGADFVTEEVRRNTVLLGVSYFF